VSSFVFFFIQKFQFFDGQTYRILFPEVLNAESRIRSLSCSAGWPGSDRAPEPARHADALAHGAVWFRFSGGFGSPLKEIVFGGRGGDNLTKCPGPRNEWFVSLLQLSCSPGGGGGGDLGGGGSNSTDGICWGDCRICFSPRSVSE